MARTPNKKKRHILRNILLGLVIIIVGLVGYMFIEANVVHLEYADVQLEDLPDAFEGTKILFLTDLHIDELNTPERVYLLVEQLSALEPDMIVLGGDYTSHTMKDMLQIRAGMTSYNQAKENESRRRDQFFIMMGNLNPPLGMYAVPGNHDEDVGSLQESTALGNVQLLSNQRIVLEKDGEKLYLVGLDDWTMGRNRIAQMADKVRGEDCVILLSHNPDVLPIVSNQPASDGKQWADLMLSGHTHGGQIRPFGILLYSSSSYGERYRTGWIRESGTELLVSNGVGTTGAPFRLMAPAQAHLITLHTVQD